LFRILIAVETESVTGASVSKVGDELEIWLMNMIELHKANAARDKEWNPDSVCTLEFWGIELAGEVGEACNIIKKLERERLGMRGSRATLQDLADELGDVIICTDLIACYMGALADPKNKLPWLMNKSLAELGNEMAAASGMINHIIADKNSTSLISMLCILINRTELIARSQKIDLDAAVKAKFNATSEKYNLQTRML
jgi:NTP pyrophosphatase (non-canonical NTP hydrolase)